MERRRCATPQLPKCAIVNLHTVRVSDVESVLASVNRYIFENHGLKFAKVENVCRDVGTPNVHILSWSRTFHGETLGKGCLLDVDPGPYVVGPFTLKMMVCVAPSVSLATIASDKLL